MTKRLLNTNLDPGFHRDDKNRKLETRLFIYNFSFMFHTLFYLPLYNALAFLVAILPGHSAGLAIIALTVVVRIVLFPLYQKAAETQLKMKKIEPEMQKIKEKYSNKQEQTEKILKLYKENNVNPFASILALFIQLPIILALFWVFQNGFSFDKELIYSFNLIPQSVSTLFLGLIDLTAKNPILGILVGLSQFIQMQISLPKLEPKKPGQAPSMQADLARGMNTQMKYVMPVIITFIASGLASAISLYWIIGNLFSIGQEFYVRKKLRDKQVSV